MYTSCIDPEAVNSRGAEGHSQVFLSVGIARSESCGCAGSVVRALGFIFVKFVRSKIS